VSEISLKFTGLDRILSGELEIMSGHFESMYSDPAATEKLFEISLQFELDQAMLLQIESM
jgi:hypothetical protein